MLQFSVDSFPKARNLNPPKPSLLCLFVKIFGVSSDSLRPFVSSLTWF